MNDLALVLDDVKFTELVERGRAVIPTAAPAWTDHNTHDPGIMLVELVAWIAEAQIYGLSRLRRDERFAYAALLGVRPLGPRPARGCLWPPDADPGGASWSPDPVIGPSDRLTSDSPDAPAFFSTHSIRLWSTHLTAVQTHLADGRVLDWTQVNRKDGATFRPFGGAPRSGDRFVLMLQGKGDAAVAPSDGLVAIGFDVVRSPLAMVPNDDDATPPISRLRVSVVDERGERPVRIETDTTGGLLRSGVLLLALDVRPRPVDRSFEIVLQSTSGGFLVSPRLQRVALNVLPIEQLEAVQDDEPAFGTGLPDQFHRLAHPPVVDADGRSSLSIATFEGAEWRRWTLVSDLQSPSQAERIVALDAAAGVLQFGNGVNGMRVPVGAALRVAYRTCDGARGNLPAGLQWKVPGALATYTNTAATAGGWETANLDDLRIETRRRVRRERPCVSRADLEERALSFADLGVTRAYEWVPEPPLPTAMRGARTLVVTGSHDLEGDDTDVTESAEWLEEVRRRLAPCVPLGQALTVVAPRYVTVRVLATLVAGRGVDPTTVQEDVGAVLRARLAVVAHVAGDPVWPFGRAVSPVTVKGWLRKVEGVARVASLQLWRDGQAAERDVALGPLGLPRLHLEPDDIAVDRPASGASR